MLLPDVAGQPVQLDHPGTLQQNPSRRLEGQQATFDRLQATENAGEAQAHQLVNRIARIFEEHFGAIERRGSGTPGQRARAEDMFHEYLDLHHAQERIERHEDRLAGRIEAGAVRGGPRDLFANTERDYRRLERLGPVEQKADEIDMLRDVVKEIEGRGTPAAAADLRHEVKAAPF